MSIQIIELVFSKVLGSSARKAILLYLADRADHGGHGVFPSKSTVASAADCCKRTVQREISNFVKEGILVEKGTVHCSHGYVCNYSIDLQRLQCLPDTKNKNRSAPEVSTSDRVSYDPCHDDRPQAAVYHPNRKRNLNKPGSASEKSRPREENNTSPPQSACARRIQDTNRSAPKSTKNKQGRHEALRAALKEHFSNEDIAFCVKEVVDSTWDNLANRRLVLDSNKQLLVKVFSKLLAGEITPVMALEFFKGPND